MRAVAQGPPLQGSSSCSYAHASRCPGTGCAAACIFLRQRNIAFHGAQVLDLQTVLKLPFCWANQGKALSGRPRQGIFKGYPQSYPQKNWTMCETVGKSRTWDAFAHPGLANGAPLAPNSGLAKALTRQPKATYAQKTVGSIKAVQQIKTCSYFNRFQVNLLIYK